MVLAITLVISAFLVSPFVYSIHSLTHSLISSLGTVGMSLCCPYFCVSEAEKNAAYFLEQTSLRSKFYERNIVFYIEKGIFSSSFAVKIPRNLVNEANVDEDIEENVVYTTEHVAVEERRHLKGN